MSIVYAVFTSDPDAAYLQGIYSTLEKAEAAMKAIASIDFPTIEEWELDGERVEIA